MKLLDLEETIERLEGEVERVQHEADVKYGEISVRKLKDTSGHGPQQSQDRKALAHQLETYINAVEQLKSLSKVKTMVNKEITFEDYE